MGRRSWYPAFVYSKVVCATQCPHHCIACVFCLADELRSKLWLLSCREEGTSHACKLVSYCEPRFLIHVGCIDVSADYHYPEPDGPKLPQGKFQKNSTSVNQLPPNGCLTPQRVAGVAESIDLDLESGHFAGFSPTLLPADYDRIRYVVRPSYFRAMGVCVSQPTSSVLSRRRVLRVHVARHDSYPPGTAHLVARLLSALGDSEADAFRVLQSLTRRMRVGT